MERKILLVSLLVIISLLSLIALFTGNYGYATVALFGFPILFYSQWKVFGQIQWIVLIVSLLLITVTSVNLLANLTGNLMYYYEFFESLVVLLITLVWKPDKVEAGESTSN